MDLKKKESKNLERYKSLFFETGLAVSLFIVLAAFEWKTAPSTDNTMPDTPILTIESDPVIRLEEKKIPPVPKLTSAIKITTAEVKTDPELFDPEWNNQPSTPIFIPVPELPETVEVEDTDIIVVPPVMPQFPGGDEALAEFIKSNIHYPEQDREVGLHGIVYVSFVVEKTGQVTHVSLKRGIGGQCDGEAVRVVKAMPTWIPGKNSLGRPVRVKLTLPVRFLLMD